MPGGGTKKKQFTLAQKNERMEKKNGNWKNTKSCKHWGPDKGKKSKEQWRLKKKTGEVRGRGGRPHLLKERKKT